MIIRTEYTFKTPAGFVTVTVETDPENFAETELDATPKGLGYLFMGHTGILYHTREIPMPEESRGAA